MRWKTKWWLAIMLIIVVVTVAKLEKDDIIRQPVTQYITTGQDFVDVKKWVASMVKDADNETIAVSADAGSNKPFSLYESMQPYKNGVLVSYTNPLAITSQGEGLVVFTGFTRESGKTITVLYDNGDEVTYGFIGKFTKLPYTVVKKGDTLALMEEAAMYLMVKRNGVALDISLLPTYLSGETPLDVDQ